MTVASPTIRASPWFLVEGGWPLDEACGRSAWAMDSPSPTEGVREVA